MVLTSQPFIKTHYLLQPSSMDFPGNFPGLDLSWSLDKFKNNFKIVISELSHDFMEFDLIGVDASVANAFRRILISEVGIFGLFIR
jgi:DNA-directed RNA polymerases I and III subunit RPAC1